MRVSRPRQIGTSGLAGLGQLLRLVFLNLKVEQPSR